MHLLVTDRLLCPRCGAGFGLVLVAEHVEDRRVLRGFLGCSNCRDRYPVEEGFADLRASPREPLEVGDLPGDDEPEGALKLAALLGVREGSGFLLLSGSSVRQAPRLAAILEEVEVVAVHPGLRGVPEGPGVSRMAVGDKLPFVPGAVRGLVLEGKGGEALLEDGFRILAPGSRLVFLDPGPGVRERLEAKGMELLLEAEAALVAVLR